MIRLRSANIKLNTFHYFSRKLLGPSLITIDLSLLSMAMKILQCSNCGKDVEVVRKC